MATSPGPVTSGGALSARAPLRLDDPGAAWRVVSGRVDVFAAELVDGEPRGRRHPIGTVAAGEALFGVGARATHPALVAVGSGGARVEPLDERGLGAEERADLAEGWVATLTAHIRAAGERSGVVLHAGRPVAPAAGETVTAAHRTVWISDASGLALEGTALSGAVPVVAGLALEVRADTVLEPAGRPGGAVWDEGRRAGLDAVGAAVLGALAEEIASAGDRQRDTLARRREAEREETERVFEGLGDVVERRREAGVVPGESPLAAACRIAGGSLGLTVTDPTLLRTTSLVARLREVARVSGFRFREVRLDDGWWRHDAGGLVGVLDGERPVALVRRRGRYEIVDPGRGTRTPVTPETAGTLAPTAYMLYASLPRGPAGGRDLVRLAMAPVRPDLLRLLAASIALGLLSLATPIAAEAIFTRAVPEGDRGQVLGLALLLLGAALGTVTAYLVQGFSMMRVQGRASTGSQAAVFGRLLSLPAAFFRRYSAGELGTRALGIEAIRESLTTAVSAAFAALLVALFNVAYIVTLDTAIGLLALGLLLGAVGLLALGVRRQIPVQRRLLRAFGETQGLALQILGAVPKLRVARAEDRAFARWAAGLGRTEEAFVDSQHIAAGVGAFAAAWQAFALAMILLVAGNFEEGSLSAGEFVAFTTAFGATAAALLGLVSLLSTTSQAVVLWERARPILDTSPETETGAADPGRLVGEVELAHVSFRYGDGPLVLDDVSLSAAPGEFIALVGPSGSGKSTMLRLLLGFEHPEAGTVSFDGQNLADLDGPAVRRQLGTVIQNARILAGTVFHNIVGATSLTIDDAWEAARIAGIADEIKRMPMGMHTFVTDAGAAFSGGQRQRLLIARAVAARPCVLLFDEATSALDNRTQAGVSAALDDLQATRIVIAHRLSTIRTADRILVLDGGRVVEECRYDELMERGGLFAALARRQIA